MQLTLPVRGQPEGRLNLERGPMAGKTFRVEVKVCGNPLCRCEEFTLRCYPDSSVDSSNTQSPLTLDLDLERRAIVKPALGEATPVAELAKGVRDEMTTDLRDYLRSYFHSLKVFYTENANLDELDPDFPPEAREGGMVGYHEILPFARPINFSDEDSEWAFDDQYCLRPDCVCEAAVLQCFRIEPQNAGAAPAGPALSFRYNYKTHRVDVVEKLRKGLSPEACLNSMRRAQPDFDAFLSNRHAQLRRLYSRFLKRIRGSKGARWRSKESESGGSHAGPELSSEPVRVDQKPGRNDPCPCGSGKKYKKCCGQD